MESLDGTDWDVVISGTGLEQSLLALALSRSGKRVLHVDKNDHYGGTDAAFSLQEAADWAKNVSRDAASSFSNVTITSSSSTNPSDGASKLSFSRAYSLALSPQLIYTRSSLLPALVSAKVDTQLEFLAVGSWWVFTGDGAFDAAGSKSSSIGTLIKVPSSREDVFADQSLDPRAKRALMKFLRFITDFENQLDSWEEYRHSPLSAFLDERFNIPSPLQQPLFALTMSASPPSSITTSFALPRIARHLRSIGLFGAGFGAVIPKWGGLSEIAQVGCRAGAVGGGVYVLNNGVGEIAPRLGSTQDAAQDNSHPNRLMLRLRKGDSITSEWVVGTRDDLPRTAGSQESLIVTSRKTCRAICIISSPLTTLFPPIAEGSPSPAVAVVVFPGLGAVSEIASEGSSQVYIAVHSADTGECPAGQCVLYVNVDSPAPRGHELVDKALANFASVVSDGNPPEILWKVQFEQHCTEDSHSMVECGDGIVCFPQPSLDLVFDDRILDRVKNAWERIVGVAGEGFMQFPEREGMGEDLEIG